MSDTPPSPASLPPFMPPPFMDPMVTDEQHVQAIYPPYTDNPPDDPSTSRIASDVPGHHNTFDPSNSNPTPIPIPNNDAVSSDATQPQSSQQQSRPSPNHPLVKRALRACSTCRKDKTKCDGLRPCSLCVKKRFPPDECVDGCANCRKLRIRCIGSRNGMPCESCTESGMACIEEEGNTRSGPALMRMAGVLDFSGTHTGYPVDAEEMGAITPNGSMTTTQGPSTSTSVPPPNQYANPSILEYQAISNYNLDPALQNTFEANPNLAVQQQRRQQQQQQQQQQQHQHTPQQSPLHTPTQPQFKATPIRAKQACTVCRKDNKKCVGEVPCERCKARGHEALCQKPTTTAPSAPLKLRCVACRRDSKKCDAKRPCPYCTEVGETCVE